ncbi:MAG: ATP-binding protein [Bacteroidota bacterium]
MADEIGNLILVITLIFLIAPAFIIIYMFVYNERKKRHIKEKMQMKLAFDAEMAKTQLEVQEQTMQTIGADLHDNIGQLLSLTSLTLNSVELEGDPKAKKKVDAAIDLTLRSIKELRQLGKLLQGDQLIAIGLVAAIRHEIDWVERSGKFKVTYVDEGELPADGNTDKDLIVFRILQEALNNIIKHASASHIHIKIEYRDAVLQLHINDNGIGFDADNLQLDKQGMGLHNIHKRAGIIGGDVIIRSKPGEGTAITVIIPYA